MNTKTQEESIHHPTTQSFRIQSVKAREILDSRGYPTLEAEVSLASGACGTMRVPAGASIGSYEAVELRDRDLSRYGGKGVLNALKGLDRVISPALIGMDARAQAEVDARLIALDGTDNKSHLGANALIGVSLAVAKAAAKACQEPLYRYIGHLFGGRKKMALPVPLINILNGGAHANNNLCIQEFMIVPQAECAFSERLRCAAEVFYKLRELLHIRGLSTAVGDEGGVAPALDSHKAAIELILEAIEKAGYVPGESVSLALDIAANELYQDREATYQADGARFCEDEWIQHLRTHYIDPYPMISLEDPLSENAWSGWSNLTAQLSESIQIVGDDLFVTNAKRLQKGIDCKAANAILIKPNQIGTLTETLSTIRLAQSSGYGIILSHRSGDTEDTSIVHIAVGTGAQQIKTGSLARMERVAKYNEMLRIEESECL